MRGSFRVSRDRVRQFLRQSAASGIVAAVDDRPDDFALARQLLARQRQHGASFEEAWAMVVEGDREREDVLAALAARREDLRRAYLRLSAAGPPKSARVVAQRPARKPRRRRLIFTE
jgi:hypothetical protein